MVYAPGKSLKNCMVSAIECTDLSRRDAVIGAAEFLGTLGLGAAGIKSYLHHQQTRYENERLDGLAKRISDKINLPQSALRDAVSELENKGHSAVSISNGNVNVLNGSYNEVQAAEELKNTVIAKPDSKFMDFVYRQLPQNFAEFVRNNVIYVVFHEKLERDLGFMKQEVDGLSIGDGIILVSTRGGRDTSASYIFYPSVVVHETRHIDYEKKNSGAHTLPSEHAATIREGLALEAQIGVLRHRQQKNGNEQISRDNKIIQLESMVQHVNERLKSANYLSKPEFYGLFKGVYPENVVLSKALLAINQKIEPESLEKVIAKIDVKDIVGEELHHAVSTVYITLSGKREDAIRELYKVASNPQEDPFKIINAIYALAYLAPEAMKIRESGYEDPRGMRLLINGHSNRQTEYLIQVKEWLRIVPFEIKLKNGKRIMVVPPPPPKFEAHGVLPSLNELLENKPVN